MKHINCAIIFLQDKVEIRSKVQKVRVKVVNDSVKEADMSRRNIACLDVKKWYGMTIFFIILYLHLATPLALHIWHFLNKNFKREILKFFLGAKDNSRLFL
jgi:hypothetical protein